MKATESDDSESEEENKLKIRKSVNSEETKPKLDKSKSEEPEDEVSFYWKTIARPYLGLIRPCNALLGVLFYLTRFHKIFSLSYLE